MGKKSLRLRSMVALLALGVFNVTIAHADDLFRYYQHLHANPELSHFEKNTSANLAAELRKAGYKVTERVGKYEDGSQAYGVVAVLENGPGPRLLIRADMDALPIVEETGLPYASKIKAKNAMGQEIGVMHACGHDLHVTALVGTARELAARRQEWRGTLVLVGQPSEETLDGAQAMLRDGLYERFGRPDMALAMHDSAAIPTGEVGVYAGATHAAVTSIDVIIRGVGGHGAAPHRGRDPIVMAAQFINQIQTIVSRNQDPLDSAVVTVGSIHGGTKRNIIPDEVKLELTTRAHSDKAMKIIIDGIRRAADGLAVSNGLAEDRKPIVKIIETETGPANVNNRDLVARVKKSIAKVLGSAKVSDGFPIMGSEDFALYSLPQREIPTVLFNVGVTEAEHLAKANAGLAYVPGTHTSKFAPIAEPAIKASVQAMSAAAIDLLQ
ncbi:M20 metallopeptidase family protein [Undibacterium fentianense]|uniref:Amidohydrolase n=1 Tax=Undibacterium fentianense TaxID=2828728 RepID=A0A941IBN2_9BURK|nr:amidohydrolase [Undibacterium fentianense]MBR7799249.1 amidohydrolase [Undibacterium fentianense]